MLKPLGKVSLLIKPNRSFQGTTMRWKGYERQLRQEVQLPAKDGVCLLQCRHKETKGHIHIYRE